MTEQYTIKETKMLNKNKFFTKEETENVSNQTEGSFPYPKHLPILQGESMFSKWVQNWPRPKEHWTAEEMRQALFRDGLPGAAEKRKTILKNPSRVCFVGAKEAFALNPAQTASWNGWNSGGPDDHSDGRPFSALVRRVHGQSQPANSR